VGCFWAATPLQTPSPPPGGGQVTAADEPLVSLKDVGMSRGVVGGFGALLGVVVSGG
jgi:hypothetical protein